MTTEPNTHLILFRHGHSRAQQEDRVPGSHEKCAGLSDLGRRQVAALGARLAATGELTEVGSVYTSLSTRAIETRDLLAELLPGRYVPECGWCEAHPGEAEGLSWRDFEQRYPRRGPAPDPFERRIPGGESWAEFFARAGARLRQVARDHPGEGVAVFTHGGVIGASFVALGDVPLAKAGAFTAEAKNTSITEWRHRGGEWRLVRYNDTAHLGLGLRQ